MPEIFPEEVSVSVPFYRQTMDFTCGAACLLMVINHFLPSITLTRENEIDIWREGTSVLALGMGRYGLAFPALKRGMKVRIMTNTEGPEFRGRIEKRLNTEQFRNFLLLYNERKERAFALGLEEKLKEDISLEDIRITMKRGGIPVMLTNSLLLGDEDAPHWIVLTGTGRGNIFFNNPLSSTPSSLFREEELGRYNNFNGEKVLVSFFG